MVRALIIDEQPLVLAGLYRLFDGTGVSVCGEASTADELMSQVEQHRPQIVLGEIQLGATSIIDQLNGIRERVAGQPVLFYSASDNPVDEARAFAERANGYLCRTCTREVLLAAIQRVAGGESLWTGADQRRLSNYLRDGRVVVGHFAPLTPREQQILVILTTGATNREISETLAISHETVKEHVQHVLKKIGVNDRTQAAVWAVRNGFA